MTDPHDFKRWIDPCPECNSSDAEWVRVEPDPEDTGANFQIRVYAMRCTDCEHEWGSRVGGGH